VINISNYTSKDNPEQAAAVACRMDDRAPHSRIRIALDWLRGLPRRWGDRWFAMNDAEAEWRGWQMTRVHGGLGRRYRDQRFNALAECARCWGTGLLAAVPCVPCLGTGRVTIGGVS
jgi:hypothetical protein